MRHIKIGILCVAILALAAGIPVLAQESAPQQESATPKDTSGPWKKVADGIWKANISAFPGAKEPGPEFAVLRLSAERYDQFKKEPTNFLNNPQTFHAKVKQVVFFEEAAPKTRATGDDFWYVVTSHWPPSSAASVAYAEWSAPEGSKPTAATSKK